MTHRSLVLALIAALAAVTPVHASPIVTNKGVRLSCGLRVDGPNTVMVLAEDGQVDLDGNGSLIDHVLHVHHRPTQTTHNLCIAVTPNIVPSIDGSFVAYGVRESTVGVGDLNGDGDTLDTVIQIHDRATGVTHNSAFAVPDGMYIHQDRDVVVTVLHEVHHGQDLTGDGDLGDHVPLVFKAGSPMRNLGYATMGTPSPNTLQFDRHTVLLFAWELGNSADLNNDGDQSDSLLMLHDVASGTTTFSGYAGSMNGFGDQIAVDRDPIRVRNRRVLVRAGELSVGQDYNNDGDTNDVVPHLFDTQTGLFTNIGFASQSDTRTDGQFVAIRCTEQGQNADLNGDQDLLDYVLVVHDVTAGMTTSTGIDGFRPSWQGGRHILGTRSEAELGVDLNQDGDAVDVVASHVDAVTGVNTVLANNIVHPIDVEGRHFYSAIYEYTDGVDLNGDGDIDDSVLHHLDLNTLVVTNLGVAVGWMWGSAHALGDRIAIVAHEYGEGMVDRNLDGDTDDHFAVVIDVAAGTRHDTNLALPHPALSFALAHRRLYQRVSEADQSQDLDQDGDLLDDVLFVHRW